MLQIVGGIHRKRKLKAPKGEETRPTSSLLRETVFNICQFTIEDARFLDLFAGAGAIGLEALSRGARDSTFVDRDKLAIKTIKENIALLKEEERSKVISLDVMDALKFFSKNGDKFDIIFADPPYGKGLSNEVLEYVDKWGLLSENGELFLEDVWEKDPQDPVLQTLVLKSSRRVGRALLRHYCKK